MSAVVQAVKCQTPSNMSVVFLCWCSCQGTLLDPILTYQDVGINVDDDDKPVIDGKGN